MTQHDIEKLFDEFEADTGMKVHGGRPREMLAAFIAERIPLSFDEEMSEEEAYVKRLLQSIPPDDVAASCGLVPDANYNPPPEHEHDIGGEGRTKAKSSTCFNCRREIPGVPSSKDTAYLCEPCATNLENYASRTFADSPDRKPCTCPTAMLTVSGCQCGGT